MKYRDIVALMNYVEAFVDAKIKYADDSKDDSHEYITTHEEINRARTALIDYLEKISNA